MSLHPFAAASSRGGFRVGRRRSPSQRQHPLPPSTVELSGPFVHDFVHLRGVRLHVVRAGRRTDPLLLLLHDAFGGWFDFAQAIAPLAERGWYVVAVDARGYGMSDKPPADAGNALRIAVGDVTGLVRALGYDSAVLVGADSFGAVAWTTAAAAPESVRALVSISACFPTDLRRALVATPWRFAATWARLVISRLPGIGYLPAGASNWLQKQIMRLWTGPDFRSSPDFARALQLRQEAMRISATTPAVSHFSRLVAAVVPASWLRRKVSCPVVLIQPAQRRWQRLAQRARRRATGPFHVTGVPGTARLPHVEAPEAFAQLVDAQVRAHLS